MCGNICFVCSTSSIRTSSSINHIYVDMHVCAANAIVHLSLSLRMLFCSTRFWQLCAWPTLLHAYFSPTGWAVWTALTLVAHALRFIWNWYGRNTIYYVYSLTHMDVFQSIKCTATYRHPFDIDIYNYPGVITAYQTLTHSQFAYTHKHYRHHFAINTNP